MGRAVFFSVRGRQTDRGTSCGVRSYATRGTYGGTADPGAALWSRKVQYHEYLTPYYGRYPRGDGMYYVWHVWTWPRPPCLLISLSLRSLFVPCYFINSKSLAPSCQIGLGFLAHNRPVVCRISHSSVTSVGTLPRQDTGLVLP